MSLGQILTQGLDPRLMMQAGQAMMHPQQPMQPPQQPMQQQTQVPGVDPMAAMRAIAQLSGQVGSEQELLERLAQLGDPPQARPQVQYPQQMMRPATPGTVPHTPQTRGEAQTNQSLGQMLA